MLKAKYLDLFKRLQMKVNQDFRVTRFLRSLNPDVRIKIPPSIATMDDPAGKS